MAERLTEKEFDLFSNALMILVRSAEKENAAAVNGVVVVRVSEQEAAKAS